MIKKIKFVSTLPILMCLSTTAFAGVFDSMFNTQKASQGAPTAQPAPAPAAAPTAVPQNASSMFQSMFESQSTAKNAPVPAPSAQHQSDYNKFFTDVPPGTVVEVGGGTVTKNADGTATYRNNSGTTYTYNQNTPISEVARNAPGMGQAWGQAYNYPTPATNIHSPSAQHQSDYNKFFTDVPVGTVVQVAGGTVTKNADGTATYRNSSGVTYTYNKNTPIAVVAKNVPALGESWKQSYYTPPASTTATATATTGSTPSAQHQSDYNKFFTDVPPGTVVEVGGGTVTKNADGTATYRNSSGVTYTYNKNTPISEVARNAPGLGESWKQAYNYTPPASTTTSTGTSTDLQRDYNRFFDEVPVGTVVQVGGGTVTKNADGTATYRNSSGTSYTYSKSTPIDEVAKNAPGMATSWSRAYGYTLPASEVPFNSVEEYIEWEKKIKMNAKFNPNYKVPDYIRMAFMITGPESAYGRYLFMKNNPQYIKDFENIHSGKLSQHPTDGTTIIKSNVDKMPPEIAKYYRENPDALLASEGFGTDPVLTRMLYTGEITLPKNINKTEWLRTHAWTPNGIIEQNNPVAYSAAGYRGLNGDGGYLLNRIDPATGKVIETPQWEGSPGLEFEEDKGAAVRGVRLAGVRSTELTKGPHVSTEYPKGAEVSTIYPKIADDPRAVNQSSTMLKNDIIQTGVVYANGSGVMRHIGSADQVYSVTMLAQNSMFATSSIGAVDQFQGKLAETVMSKCNNSSLVQSASLDGSYQLYSQSCVINELVTGATGIFKEMDGLEKQIIEDEKAQGQAGKENNDREAKIKAEKKKMDETNAKIKKAIDDLKTAKEAQKKAQEALAKAKEALAAANATKCPEDDDGSCASSKATAIEAATKAVASAEKELAGAEKKLIAATSKMVNLLVEKYGNETSVVMSLLTGTIMGETDSGDVSFKVNGNDFTLIDLGDEIKKLTGTSAERAEQMIGGEPSEERTLSYFEDVIQGYENNEDNGSRTGLHDSSDTVSSISGPRGDALTEILDVFGSMENGADYLENIALAVTEYANNESDKLITAMENMKTPAGRVGEIANKIQEKKTLIENYKKMMKILLSTLDQNLGLFRNFFNATKDALAANSASTVPLDYYNYLLTFNTADLNKKLNEGYFSKVDYVKIQKEHECLINNGKKNTCVVAN